MLKLCCERGTENKTFCGTRLELLLFMLLLLSLHLLLLRHTDKHRQDQTCLWEILVGSAHVANSPTRELAPERLFRVGAKQS